MFTHDNVKDGSPSINLNKDIFCKKYPARSDIFSAPEKVIQFGTGVLLRGLVDYYIDQANRSNVFNGRVVIVKSTQQGNSDTWKEQDYLYTHCIKGIEDGKSIETELINASISRVLVAKTQWSEILSCAANPEINIMISNTTERGLVYQEERLGDQVPESFPMKVLAYLYNRYQALGNTENSAMVVIPTELVEQNGDILKSFVMRLGHFNELETAFFEWLDRHVIFCNSLVDRIVPGKPGEQEMNILEQKLGYKDDYLLVSEPFNLWAIEGNVMVKNLLSFHTVNDGIKIVDDISTFKELKLRLLNATHTLSCGRAILSGFKTVSEALHDKTFYSHMSNLINEIKVSIPKSIDKAEIASFAGSVLNRFANPYIQHQWTSIILNYTEKMKIRVVPLIIEYYRKYGDLPPYMMDGWMAYFEISIPDIVQDNSYYKYVHDHKILLQDQYSIKLYDDVRTHGIDKTIDDMIEFLFSEYSDVAEIIQMVKRTVIEKYVSGKSLSNI